jgi:hypothetical protein
MMTQSRREEIHYYDTNSFLLSGIMEIVETGFGPALKQTTVWQLPGIWRISIAHSASPGSLQIRSSGLIQFRFD